MVWISARRSIIQMFLWLFPIAPDKRSKSIFKIPIDRECCLPRRLDLIAHYVFSIYI
jgi:hypothetical protein